MKALGHLCQQDICSSVILIQYIEKQPQRTSPFLPLLRGYTPHPIDESILAVVVSQVRPLQAMQATTIIPHPSDWP